MTNYFEWILVLWRKRDCVLILFVWPATTLSLSGGIGDMANSSGHVRIRRNGVTGRICSTYWDDNDAKVACKQLGYSNGLAYGLSSATVGPFLMSEVNCVGNETSVFRCQMGNASCNSQWAYVAAPDAGVFCFNSTSKLHLEKMALSCSSALRLRVEHFVHRTVIWTVHLV